MEFLSHRGFWQTADEKNSICAFLRSFELGFGTETDVRDYGGRLVISHDPAADGALGLDAFLDLYHRYGAGLPLALNIKADGLQPALEALLRAHGVRGYFCFDMSVPDAVGYARRGLPFFTRHSDVEPEPVLYARAAGVWLDAFERDWCTDADVARHLDAGKRVCLVSPELHGRDPAPFWRAVRGWRAQTRRGLMLCTDRPTDAAEYFR